MKHANPFFPIRTSQFVLIAVVASLFLYSESAAQKFSPPDGETVIGKQIEQHYIGPLARTVWTNKCMYYATYDFGHRRWDKDSAVYCAPKDVSIISVHQVNKGGDLQTYMVLSDGSVRKVIVSESYEIGKLDLKMGETPKKLIGDALYTLTTQNIFVSRDTARTWMIDTIGLGGTPKDIAIDSQQFVYAITNNGLFRQHPDTNIWRAMAAPAKISPNNIFIDRRNRIYLAVNQNGYRLLYHSLDRGATWNVDTAGMGYQNFTGFGDDSYGNIYAIAQDPYKTTPDKIYRSNGVSWTRIDAPLTMLNADSLSMFSGTGIFTSIGGDSILLVTSKYGVFSSADQGITWSESNNGIAAEHVHGLVLTPSNHFVASSTLGVFRRAKTDTVWTKTFPTNGYVAGQTIFRDNSGAIYTLGTLSAKSDIFNTPPHLTMKSIDDGVTWLPDTLGLSGITHNSAYVFFVDETGTQHLASYGAGSTPSSIYMKLPGKSWAGDTLGYPTNHNSPQAFGSDGKGFLWLSLGAQTPLLRRSITGGAWTPDTLGLSGEVLNTFAAAKNGIVYAGGFAGVWRRSGTSWSKLPPPSGLYTTAPAYAVSIDSMGALIACYSHFDINYNAIGDGVFSTTDDGKTWTNLGHVDTTTFVQFVSYGNVTYGLSYFDGVFVFTTGASGVSEKFFPASFNTLTVFPNPATSELRINYSIPKHSDVVLSIFDMTGKMITATASETHDAGSYETLWDVRSLPNGSYILKLTACGESVTKVVKIVK